MFLLRRAIKPIPILQLLVHTLNIILDKLNTLAQRVDILTHLLDQWLQLVNCLLGVTHFHFDAAVIAHLFAYIWLLLLLLLFPFVS